MREEYPTKLTSCERDATGYIISFPYDIELLGDLKASIPVQYREWIPEYKVWHIAEEFAYVISQFFDNFPKIPPPKRKPKTWLQEQGEHNSRMVHDPIYWMMERMADLAAEQLPAISSIEPTQIMEKPIYLNKNISLDKFEQLQGQVLHLEKTLNKHCDKPKGKSKYT